MKWQYFIGACALAGYVVIMAGAPAMTVYGGVALAALWNFFNSAGSPARLARMEMAAEGREARATVNSASLIQKGR